MSDNAETAANKVECPADRDPGVRLLIGAALALAGAVYCAVDSVPKPAEPLSWETINDYAEHVLHVHGPWVCGAAAGILIGFAIRAFRRRIVADGEGMTVNKRRFAWSQFTGLDASLLKDKGRLTLKAGDEAVTLDRYRYKNFKELVVLIEQHVSVAAADGPAEPADSDDA